MKLLKLLLPVVLLSLPACASLNAPAVTPSPIPSGPEIHAVFQGNTPCSAQARALPQIPSDPDCEQMIWSLILYQDSETGTPTTYQLNAAYGMSKPNTNDLLDGGTSIVMDGKWTITTGTKSDPEATVYQLNPDDPPNVVSFLRVDENLLHVLDSEKELLIGNGAWSYTLNRMDNQNPAQSADLPASFPNPPTRPPLPSMPADSAIFGVFDGRSPCHELVVELLKTPPSPDCLKIKMRLTLYQDAATGAPGTYLIIGTSTYHEGKWTLLNGMDGDPNAVIYQLHLDDGHAPVSLLGVDENHLFLLDRDLHLLVGNELFSYTLSRTNPDTP